MKIRILIAGSDTDYVEHLSHYLAEHDAEVLEVSVCTSVERAEELFAQHNFDAALLEADIAKSLDLHSIRLPLILTDGTDNPDSGLTHVAKYQRISGIVRTLFECYAELPAAAAFGVPRAQVTVVWSAAGGCGKTTVALAFAAQCVSEGKRTVYLNLEPFSSASVYFPMASKSISTVFDKLDSNVTMLLQSIRQEDRESGVLYFGAPDNYDDMNILTSRDLDLLINACAQDVDELVVDLGDGYDEKTRALLEQAGAILYVVDGAPAGAAKWDQFRGQNDLYERLRPKITLISNKGARVHTDGLAGELCLPLVQSDDPVVVYKTLSGGYLGQSKSDPRAVAHYEGTGGGAF